MAPPLLVKSKVEDEVMGSRPTGNFMGMKFTNCKKRRIFSL